MKNRKKTKVKKMRQWSVVRMLQSTKPGPHKNKRQKKLDKIIKREINESR